MIGPSIDPSEVGLTGLIWLFLSYGFVLYFSSNLISEGSELLLLVPELAGLVGGVVLPLLGAVPDGAIILFSGLGDIETAQETLSVGVGTLAGSTIMLLTIPFAFSIYAGRVDIEDGVPNYFKKPKLTKTGSREGLFGTGVTLTEGVQHSGKIMMLTTIPYFIIQVPAYFMHGPTEEIAKSEHWWSLAGLSVCIAGLIAYMSLQLRISRQGEDKDKRMAVVKKMLQEGQVSLSGAVAANLKKAEEGLDGADGAEYQSLQQKGDPLNPPQMAIDYLKGILGDSFRAYDTSGDGLLDRLEVYVFFNDFHETISEKDCGKLFDKFDRDSDGYINYEEFIRMAYALIKSKTVQESGHDTAATNAARDSVTDRLADSAFNQDGEEEEEIPEEFTSLPPDKQQLAIKKRAFVMLGIGTCLVVVFSDPMVDVMQEIANRAGLSPFYVSFILAPLASNASELFSSMYYASKKTRKTITVSISTLCGAAALNNTFCLSIFFFLIFFRGLAWSYTAETITIVTVEIIVGLLVQKDVLTTFTGLCILSIFPLSLVLVATLEFLGFD